MLTMRGGDQLIGGFWFIPVLFRSAICAMLTLWIVRAVFDVAVVYTKEIQDKYPLVNRPLSWICLAICGNTDGEVRDVKRHELRITFASVALLALGVIVLLAINRFPLIEHDFLAATIFLVGFLAKQITVSTLKLWKVSFVVIGTVLCVWVSALYPTSFSETGFWATCRILVIGSIGTWTWVIISRAIERRGGVVSNFLIYVGKNTMIVLALHFLCFKIVNALKIWYYDLPTSQLGTFPLIANDPSGNGIVWFLLYIIVGVGLPIGIKALYDRSRFAGKL